MLASMTGFSATTAELTTKEESPLILFIEIKSLNSRFFEISNRLPSGLSHLEHKLVSILKKKLIRGRVFLNIRVGAQGVLLEKIVPSVETAKGYLDAAEFIKKQCNLSGDISLADLLNFPDVFVFEKGILTQEQEQEFMNVFEQCVQEIIKSRQAEGENLRDDLQRCFASCKEKIDQVDILAIEVLEKKKEEISTTRTAADEGDEQARVHLEELYKMIDKIDVHEEVIRFKSHLNAIEKIVGDEQLDKGRRLDFTLQELMREINTVTAKCSSYPISTVAVDIKVELEKAREQAQNIV
jgi:uncharacterized protein (TIGR00255 family)